MERIKLAEKIISTCREMNASGLNQGTSGNVSARYTGGMLITPSGIAYSKMTPDMSKRQRSTVLTLIYW